MPEFINKILNKLLLLYHEKKYGKLASYSLLLLIIAIVIIWITCSIIFRIYDFFAMHFNGILCIICAFAMAYYYSYNNKKKKNEQIHNERENNNIIDENTEKEIAENNYIIIRRCLFAVINEVYDIIGVKKLDSLSELNAPSHLTRRADILMYKFFALKQKDVNTSTIKKVLQQRINQKLLDFEFPDIKQNNFIYSGKAYPMLNIYEVTDESEYIQIVVSWASKQYFDLLSIRRNNIMNSNLIINNNFNDDDF